MSYLGLDISSGYTPDRKGVIIDRVHGDTDYKNVVFELGNAEAAMYGAYDSKTNKRNVVNGGNKIRMDDEVITREIVKLYRKKKEYTAREISYYLGQNQTRVSKCLKQVAEFTRGEGYKCYWTLKTNFMTD